LKDDAVARSAQGHAHGELAPARHTAGKEHVGDIRAGNQKHQRHNGHEDLERHREGVAQVRNAAASGSELDAGVGKIV